MTALVRKDSSRHDLDAENLLELFESVGTYCSYELKAENLQIIMSGLQRAAVEDLALEVLSDGAGAQEDEGSVVQQEESDELENLSD